MLNVVYPLFGGVKCSTLSCWRRTNQWIFMPIMNLHNVNTHWHEKHEYVHPFYHIIGWTEDCFWCFVLNLSCHENTWEDTYIYTHIIQCLHRRDSPCFIPIQPHFFGTGTDRNPHVQKLSGRKGVMMVWSTFLFASFTQDSFRTSIWKAGRESEGKLTVRTGRSNIIFQISSLGGGNQQRGGTWKMMKHVSKQEVWGLSNQCEGFLLFFFFPESFETSASWRCRNNSLWFEGVYVCMHICITYIFTYVFVHMVPPVQVSTFMYIYIYVCLLHTDYISPSTKLPKVGRAHHGDSVPTYWGAEGDVSEVSKLGLQFTKRLDAPKCIQMYHLKNLGKYHFFRQRAGWL